MIELGIDRLAGDSKLFKKYENMNIGLLCHSASVDRELNHSIEIFIKLFGDNFKKIFGPQHGLVSDVQDNMIETDHYIHPYFQRPVYSLYSETRSPTNSMLEGLDVVFVDLQDVGTRVYTYISTLGLLMKECEKKGIKVIVLDRPNPVGGKIIEGNILEEGLKSFVGHYQIPQRHGLTMGEVARFAKKVESPDCELEVIDMKNWTRDLFFHQTGLTWINPSPNLSTPNGAYTFPGTVLFEGTNISEARGTTRALEMVGFPGIEAFEFTKSFKKITDATNLEGFVLRPVVFMPTFQKHAGKPCGGVHIHVTDHQVFKPWSLSQLLCQHLYHELGDKFEWNAKPYEYELDRLSIDFINGTEDVRHWVEKNQSYDDLQKIDKRGHEDFLNLAEECLFYKG